MRNALASCKTAARVRFRTPKWDKPTRVGSESIRVLEGRQMELVAEAEPKRFVQGDGGVIGPRVEEWLAAGLLDLIHHDLHEPARLSGAGSRGVGAYAAHFDLSGQVHALAGHG